MEYTAEQKELMLHSKAWPDRWAMARLGYRLDILVNDEEKHVRDMAIEKLRELDNADGRGICLDKIIEDAEKRSHKTGPDDPPPPGGLGSGAMELPEEEQKSVFVGPPPEIEM